MAEGMKAEDRVVLLYSCMLLVLRNKRSYQFCDLYTRVSFSSGGFISAVPMEGDISNISPLVPASPLSLSLIHI